MYRGGKICLTDHFKPLWARNVPKFGIAHAMALGVRHFYNESNYENHVSINNAFSLVTVVAMVSGRNSGFDRKRCCFVQR